MSNLASHQFCSCFISYSTKDETFARRLYERMCAEHLRVWFAPEDVKGGEKLHEQIDIAIRAYDKLVLILSEHSVKSEWVTTEIRKAWKAQLHDRRRKLFPIRLCSFETIREWEHVDTETGRDLAVEVREYFTLISRDGRTIMPLKRPLRGSSETCKRPRHHCIVTNRQCGLCAYSSGILCRSTR